MKSPCLKIGTSATKMIPLDPFEVVCLQAKLIVSNRVCYLNKLHFYLDTGAQPLYVFCYAKVLVVDRDLGMGVGKVRWTLAPNTVGM